MSEPGLPESNEVWRDMLLGVYPDLQRMRRLFRHVPSDPRCKLCLSPHGGVGGPVLRLFGYGRYPRNPQLCNNCFKAASKHPGGAEIEISALFADIRGSVGLAETMSPIAYSNAVGDYIRIASHAVRQRGRIVEKLLGDGVMALFIPGFVGGDHAGAAVEAARTILREVSLPVGVGVHTGQAWAGFVAASTRYWTSPPWVMPSTPRAVWARRREPASCSSARRPLRPPDLRRARSSRGASSSVGAPSPSTHGQSGS